MPKKPETKYRGQLLRALKKKFGGRWFVNHADPFDEVGIPDIFGCVGGVFVAIECKVGNNTTEAVQDEVLKEIRDNGGVGIASRSIDRTLSRLETALGKTKGCRIVYIEAEEELPRNGNGHRQNTYDVSESAIQACERVGGPRSNRVPRNRRRRVAKRVPQMA